MKKILGLIISFLVLSGVHYFTTSAQFAPAAPEQGGTGSTSTPSNNQILIGNDEVYVVTAIPDCTGDNKLLFNSSTRVFSCAADTGGSGGLASSSPFSANQIPIIFDSNTLFGDTGLTFSSSTDLLQVFGIVSSTEIISPSSTFDTLRFTNASGTNLYAINRDSDSNLFTNVSRVADGASAVAFENKWDGNVATPTDLAIHTKWSFQDNADADKDFLLLRYDTNDATWQFNNPNTGTGVGGGRLVFLAGGINRSVANTVAIGLFPDSSGGSIAFYAGVNNLLTIQSSGKGVNLNAGAVFSTQGGNPTIFRHSYGLLISGDDYDFREDGSIKFGAVLFGNARAAKGNLVTFWPQAEGNKNNSEAAINFKGWFLSGRGGYTTGDALDGGFGARGWTEDGVTGESSSNANATGTDLYIFSGAGTGNNEVKGSIFFQTPSSTASGTFAQTVKNRGTLSPLGLWGFGGLFNTTSSVPSSTVHIAEGSATTTITIGAVGSPACIEIRDTDDGGFSYLTVLDGIETFSSSSCR